MIVDTAGRLHTKANLMEELKKVRRIIARGVEGAPHEVFLVVDATIGQNAIDQAPTFNEAMGVTVIVSDGARRDGEGRGGRRDRKTSSSSRSASSGSGSGSRICEAFDADLFLEAIFGEPDKGWVHSNQPLFPCGYGLIDIEERNS